MQNPELFACLSKERKENLLGTLLFRPSIYERLYYEEEMVRKQIVCYEEFLQIVRNPQIRAAAPEIDFEFEEFSANSYLSLVDEYLYWNKVPGDILLRLKKAAEDALAYARENKNFRQKEETLLGTLHTIQGYLGEISISEMLDAYVTDIQGTPADPNAYHMQWDGSSGDLTLSQSQDGAYNVVFTIEGTVKDNLTSELGTQEIRVVKTHIVKTTTFELEGGRIISCERLADEGAEG